MIFQVPYSVENLQCVTFINQVIDPEESYLCIGIGKKTSGFQLMIIDKKNLIQGDSSDH
jgi:hypothetical protein